MTITCIRCHRVARRHPGARSMMCIDCIRAHHAEGQAATAEVTKAIRYGLIGRAREYVCVDCKAQARDWDHRDYLKPLAIDPVCKPCNLRRGVAFDSVLRPTAPMRAPFVSLPWNGKTDRRRRRSADKEAA